MDPNKKIEIKINPKYLFILWIRLTLSEKISINKKKNVLINAIQILRIIEKEVILMEAFIDSGNIYEKNNKLVKPENKNMATLILL